MIRKLARAALGANLATAIRLVRYGPRDAASRAAAAYKTVGPFAVPEPARGGGGDDTNPAYANAEWDPSVAVDTGAPLPHSKVLDLEDFKHPELVRWVREVYAHELRRFGPRFPEGVEDRKQWEVAMIVRALADYGAIRPDAELLGVGVGNDPTSFYLTNHVKRVYATDYFFPGEDRTWAEADTSMLTDPGTNWPFAWEPRRLVAQHMDGRDLRYDDNSFDGIFSAGSIEHFGTLEEIGQSAAEMYRVLKPGGILALTTELRVDGPGHGFLGNVYFTPELIHKHLIGDHAWDLLDPAEFVVSDATRSRLVSHEAACATFQDHVRKEGRLFYHRYRQVSYPFLTMQGHGYIWTSICLALRKR